MTMFRNIVVVIGEVDNFPSAHQDVWTVRNDKLSLTSLKKVMEWHEDDYFIFPDKQLKELLEEHRQ